MKRYTDAPVRFSFRHFPVESIHPAAFQASARLAVRKEQNKFMEYHDLLYEYQDIISEERLPVFAAGLGLDMDRFTTCMGTQRYASTIRKDLSDATTLGVVGTPTFLSMEIDSKARCRLKILPASSTKNSRDQTVAEKSGSPPFLIYRKRVYSHT